MRVLAPNCKKPLPQHNLNPDVLVDEGIQLLMAGKTSAAMKKFNDAISINPNKTEYWTARGLAYYHMKNYEQAISDFTQAISLSPNCGSLYLYRAGCYGDLHRMDPLIADLEAGARLGDVQCQEFLRIIAVYV